MATIPRDTNQKKFLLAFARAIAMADYEGGFDLIESSTNISYGVQPLNGSGFSIVEIPQSVEQLDLKFDIVTRGKLSFLQLLKREYDILAGNKKED